MKQDQGIQLELKEMDHKVNKFQRDSKEAATKVPFSFLSGLRSWCEFVRDGARGITADILHLLSMSTR